MFSGRWLVDYDENYINPVGYSVTWSGGITAAVNDAWDEGDESSDKPAFVCNAAYEGATGGVPVGEAGNMYTQIGMYLTSFQSLGLQVGGDFIRMQYQWVALPDVSVLSVDENGTYLPMNFEVIESTYAVDTVTNGYTYADHDDVTKTDGKIYITYAQDAELTITYTYADGTTAAETYTETMPVGTAYSVESPVIEGYTANYPVVEGTLDGNTAVNVVYTPNAYTLTIHYVYEDGTTAAADYVATVYYGVEYSVASPAIEGYTVDIETVEGTMGAANVEVTVTYTEVVVSNFVWGDADCDGVCSYTDLVAIYNMLTGGEELSEQGWINANVGGTDPFEDPFTGEGGNDTIGYDDVAYIASYLTGALQPNN